MLFYKTVSFSTFDYLAVKKLVLELKTTQKLVSPTIMNKIYEKRFRFNDKL